MTPYKIEFLPSAKKELAQLPHLVQQRISIKLESLKENPYPPRIKPLKNGGGRLRLREETPYQEMVQSAIAKRLRICATL